MFKTIFGNWLEINLFNYISVRTALAAITALILGWVLGPLVIRLATRFKLNQSIRSDGPQTHLKKIGTPTMGGLLILGSTLISVLLWQDFRNVHVWILSFSLVGFATLGFIDDYLKISRKNSDGLLSRVKLKGQFLIAIVVVCWIYITQEGNGITLIYLPFYKYPAFDLGIFWIPLAVFIVVGTSNAVNLTDGLDGLAISLFIIALGTMGVISYLAGHAAFSEYLQIPFVSSAEATVAIGALLGACTSFLWYNCHPAKIFMGDTGSLALGGFLGVLALLLKREILLAIVAGVFVVEVFSVMIQVFHFKRTGKRIFLMAPIHHHFEQKGWAETTVVTRFTIVGTLFSLVALLSLKVQ